MKVETTYRNIWEIAYPIILGSLATTVLNLTDTAFISRVGEIELGAMALTSVFYFVVVMVGMALGTGAQIIMARRAGEGNTVEIGKLFDHSFILLTVLAILFFVLLLFFADNIFAAILHSPDIVAASNVYMDTRCYGILFTMVSITFRSFYIAISHTRIITYSAIIMLLLNVVLDYLLIFGHYGFPEMGMKGAALASVISEAVSLVYLVIYSAIKHEFKHFNLFKFREMSMERINSIVHLSSPVILQNTISMSSWFLFFVLIEHIGEHELAISNIIRATYMVLMTPIWGFASATNSMVSNIIGQNRIGDVKHLVRKIINIGLLTNFVLFAVTLISPAWLLRITTSDESLIDDAMGCYYIILGAMFLFTVSIILVSTISGSGNTKAAMVIEIINIFIYLVYVYICTIVIQASIEVVWLSEIVYWIMMGLLASLYLKYGKWQNVKI
jgi:putative MATE family efflux protein